MRPTSDDLRKLYEVDGLTTYEIGDIYGVNRVSVGRWLQKHGIPIRPSGIGLAARGIEPPSKEDLARMIHSEFLSYDQVASLYGVDSTAVPYWLTKHGIEKPKQGVARTKGRTLLVNTDVVREMYESGHSLESIANHYGVSQTKITQACEEIDLERRPPGFTGERYITANGLEVRSSYEIKTANWLSSRGVDFSYEPSYPYGSKWKADFIANGWFIEIWGVKGCESYDKKKESKIRFCDRYGIPLIQLNSWHFLDSRAETMNKIMSKALVAAKAQGMLF